MSEGHGIRGRFAVNDITGSDVEDIERAVRVVHILDDGADSLV